MRIPLKSIVIGLISTIWLIVSTNHWALEFYDLDKLLFSIGFFLIGLYVAYDQWYKTMKEENDKDLKADFAQMCNSYNRLENKIIEMNK